MGRGPQANPAFAKIFAKADSGVDLEKAWKQHGGPTTLKNLQRAYGKHREAAAAAPSATPAGTNRPLSGGAAGISKAAKTPATRLVAEHASTRVENSELMQGKRWVVTHQSTDLQLYLKGFRHV